MLMNAGSTVLVHGIPFLLLSNPCRIVSKDGTVKRNDKGMCVHEGKM